MDEWSELVSDDEIASSWATACGMTREQALSALAIVRERLPEIPATSYHLVYALRYFVGGPQFDDRIAFFCDWAASVPKPLRRVVGAEGFGVVIPTDAQVVAVCRGEDLSNRLTRSALEAVRAAHTLWSPLHHEFWESLWQRYVNPSAKEFDRLSEALRAVCDRNGRTLAGWNPALYAQLKSAADAVADLAGRRRAARLTGHARILAELGRSDLGVGRTLSHLPISGKLIVTIRQELDARLRNPEWGRGSARPRVNVLVAGLANLVFPLAAFEPRRVGQAISDASKERPE